MTNVLKSPYPDTPPITVTAQPSGTQAIYSPNTPPFDKGILQNGFHVAEPQTAWTSGQWAQCGNGDHCRWTGSQWLSVGNGYSPDRLGGAPELLPFSYADITARSCTGYGSWTASDAFTTADGDKCFWNGAGRWARGYAPWPNTLMLNFMHNEGAGLMAYDWSPSNTGAWLGLGGNVEAEDPRWVPFGLEFDYGDQTVTTSADSNWNGALTIVCAIYSYSGGHYHSFISKNDGTNINAPIDFLTDNAATPNLWGVRGNAAGYYHWGGPAIAIGAAYMIGIRFPSNQMNAAPTFIVNTTLTTGTLIGNTTTGGTVGTSNRTLYVGRRQDNVCQLHGQMGPLWAYNSYLSDTQLTTVVYPAMKLNVTLRNAGISLP